MSVSAIAWADAARQDAFGRWLAGYTARYGIEPATLAPASADAGLHRYLRVGAKGGTLVVMDAPPPHEDVRPFVHVAGLLQAAGLHVPQVLAVDADHGFLLLTDLGDRPYVAELQHAAPAHADRLMRDALAALLKLQQGVPADALPRCDEARLQAQLALFAEWCVRREFGIEWTPAQQQAWDGCCKLLVASALAQPVVAVHADWTPRHLMVSDPNPGVLHFQGALAGPLTCDLASLLRDACVSWDEEQELDWAVRWWQQARAARLPAIAAYDDFGEFWRALEWMGLLRHLQLLGLFCRLKHRDAKPQCAAELPRLFGYVTKVALRYPALAPLLRLIEPMSGSALAAGFSF